MQRKFMYRGDCLDGTLFEGEEAIAKASSEGWLDSPTDARQGLVMPGAAHPGDQAPSSPPISIQRDASDPGPAWLPPLPITPADVARVAHEVNRAYCAALGDDTVPAWDEAPDWHRESALARVIFHATHPDAGPEASHENWLRVKEAEGWTYGETKDPEAKTHPCMVPFAELPLEQQIKDHLFRAVVHGLIEAGLVRLDEIEIPADYGEQLPPPPPEPQGAEEGKVPAGAKGGKRKRAS